MGIYWDRLQKLTVKLFPESEGNIKEYLHSSKALSTARAAAEKVATRL
jgi:hypothetical protein